MSDNHSVRPLPKVAEDLGLNEDDFDMWGTDRAKLTLEAAMAPRTRAGKGRLILVSAMTPTPAGEGKTTTSIGLAQGLQQLGESVCCALREPSLGPIFGIKGGGTGGGASTLHPSNEINMHFTGDLHAISSANNLLSSMIDNHLHFNSAPRLNSRRLKWRRVMDMNDRALRHINVGLGGPTNGVPREEHFDITAASEVMAILCLADGPEDLRERLGRILVGPDLQGNPVTAKDLGATGAMVALLRDALRPNLVQTREGVPALVHGGPFANIAHGCNSILATRAALARADWTITEAGFGFDLGAEKFFDIKCRVAGLDTAAVVLVSTVRALKYHGGTSLKELTKPDPAAVARGLVNLDKHLDTLRTFGEVPIVTCNRRDTDTEEEIAVIATWAEAQGVVFAASDPYGAGGPGCVDLARAVVEHADRGDNPYVPLYDLEDTVVEKIEKVARKAYGASEVVISGKARNQLRRIKKLGQDKLPICIAKTPASLSDDPSRRGRPTDFALNVQEVRMNTGAGFLVVITGAIMRMPGLPRRPSALDIDLVDGEIIGLQ